MTTPCWAWHHEGIIDLDQHRIFLDDREVCCALTRERPVMQLWAFEPGEECGTTEEDDVECPKAIYMLMTDDDVADVRCESRSRFQSRMRNRGGFD